MRQERWNATVAYVHETEIEGSSRIYCAKTIGGNVTELSGVRACNGSDDDLERLTLVW